jgi:hypothetical protein
LPRSSTGKILRNDLKARAGGAGGARGVGGAGG